MRWLKKKANKNRFDLFLTDQKVEALYMQAPISNATVFVISSLFYFALQGHLDPGLLGLWVLLMWSAAGYRLVLWQVHRRRAETKSSDFWLRHYTLGSVLVGGSWSAIHLFLQNMQDVIAVVALFMLLFGVLSSSVAILSVHIPAFVGYTAPQVLVAAGTLVGHGDASLTLLALALLLYLLMLLLFARNAFRQFKSTLQLASENQVLATQLDSENREREVVIRERTAELEREVGEREAAEQRAKMQFGILRSVLDSTPDLIFFKDYRDRNGVYIGCNEAFCEFVGRGMKTIIGSTDLDLFDAEVGTFFRGKDREMLDANQTRINEEWVTYPDGHKVLLSTLKTPFHDQDDEVVGVLGVSRDITEQKQAEDALRRQQQSLRHMAHHDALTNLPNRLLLTDRLSQSILKAHREGTGLGLFFIDLDRFKQINDSLGHSVGDQLLKAVSDRLLECVRENDTVARLGGDEFVILAENLPGSAAANTLIEKVLGAFVQPFNLGEQLLQVSASIGISLYPNDGGDSETLLSNADAAMYRAKADGRNAYRYYSAEMTEQALARVALETALRVALSEDQFELHYQPQVNIHTGRLVGAEALLRWIHPAQGQVMPGAFISIAEESGLIKEIGRWVLEQACVQLRDWRGRGISGFHVAVNLSGREMSQLDLVESVDRALAQSGCDPTQLELEITEGFLVQQPAKAKEILQTLRARGVMIAVDDFGTGYSSLSYLKQYPISKLKIDQSFVRDLSEDADDQAIVRAIIALGRSLDMEVIGEGVETEAQASYLRAEGCNQAQGFLYARPMSVAQFETYLRDHLDSLSQTDQSTG